MSKQNETKLELSTRGELPAKAAETAKPTMEQKYPTKSKANFICFNTANIRGTRINLDTLESYAPNGELSIQLGRSTGRINLEFLTKEERDLVLERLDAYCL